MIRLVKLPPCWMQLSTSVALSSFSLRLRPTIEAAVRSTGRWALSYLLRTCSSWTSFEVNERP